MSESIPAGGSSTLHPSEFDVSIISNRDLFSIRRQMDAEGYELIPNSSNFEEEIFDEDVSSQNENSLIRVRDDLFTNDVPTESDSPLLEINAVVEELQETAATCATGLRKCFEICESVVHLGGHCVGTKWKDRDVLFSWGLFTKGCVFFGIPYVYRERDPDNRYCAVSIVDHVLRKYHGELMCQVLSFIIY